MKRIGIHRVDGRSYWFAGYFGMFDRELMIRYAGEGRAKRFDETFDGRVPFPEARIVKVFDPDPVAAGQFSDTFHVPVSSSLEEFADGLDGVIVPFPAGGHARDYGAIRPLVERGISLFLDRIILEQSDLLAELFKLATRKKAPLHVTCFLRYVADLVTSGHNTPVKTVTVSSGGEPVGYGADLLDLIDELMAGEIESVENAGDQSRDVLNLRYSDGRSAVLELLHGQKKPMVVTVQGEGWEQLMTLDGSQNHHAAFRQFDALIRSIETRIPPVPYEQVIRHARVLHFAERQVFGVKEDVTDYRT